jgi:hypothetical protein
MAACERAYGAIERGTDDDTMTSSFPSPPKPCSARAALWLRDDLAGRAVG